MCLAELGEGGYNVQYVILDILNFVVGGFSSN
jgi:hypothetical protein